MEIKINFTIIIQAFNFLIAYIILRKFLLKPVMNVIEHERMDFQGLLSTVNSRKVIVMQKEIEQKNRWISYQQEFVTHAPSFSLSNENASVFKNIGPIFMPESLPDAVIENKAQQLATLLIKKVEHVG